MTVKRFREVRRGYVTGAAPYSNLNNIFVLLEGDRGLGFTTRGRGVLFMEVFLMAISPFRATAGGCLIRRCVFAESLGTWEVSPELDHRADPARNLRTTPFPALGVDGAFPLEFIDFSTSGSAGSYSALIQYQFTPVSNPNPTTKVHYQITMEGFEDSDLFDLP